MNLTVWCMIAIPMLIGCMILNVEWKYRVKSHWNILAKCLTTWMVVSTGALGLLQQEGGQADNAIWILVALGLFLIADGCLEIQFFLGMIVFGIGHGVLIYWLFQHTVFRGTTVLLWVILWAASLLLFRKEVARGKEDHKLYAMMLYPGMLMGMTAMAIQMAVRNGSESIWIALGATLFSISDMMVGKSFFYPFTKRAEYVALTLYYSGIFCFALYLWM